VTAARRADPSGVTFAFAEGCLFVNVILWAFYAHSPRGAVVALIAMVVLWGVHRWEVRLR